VNRIDLLHLIRAACDVLDVDEVVVFASQAARARTVVGACPEAHDLRVSKLCAFRTKDLEFVGALIAARVVGADTLRQRLDTVPDTDLLTVTRVQGWLAPLPDAG
jgi:hypothetical protein